MLTFHDGIYFLRNESGILSSRTVTRPSDKPLFPTFDRIVSTHRERSTIRTYPSLETSSEQFSTDHTLWNSTHEFRNIHTYIPYTFIYIVHIYSCPNACLRDTWYSSTGLEQIVESFRERRGGVDRIVRRDTRTVCCSLREKYPRWVVLAENAPVRYNSTTIDDNYTNVRSRG